MDLRPGPSVEQGRRHVGVRTAEPRWTIRRMMAFCEVAMPIEHLASHSAAYVSVTELADYWRVDRHQIYKFIDIGGLRAIRLGPRVYRIAVKDAIAFEHDARIGKGEQSRD